MSFAVTGLGRCGTMALARFLGTAPGWTVKHQNDSEACRLGYRMVKHWRRFAQPKYGEVSCALMPVLAALPCDAKAVIVRSLRDTAVSAANLSVKVGMGDKVPLIDELPFTVKMLDLALWHPDVELVRYDALFDGMEDTMLDFAEMLGVEELGKFDLSVRHNQGAKKFKNFDELSDKHRRIVDSCMWFEKRWIS